MQHLDDLDGLLAALDIADGEICIVGSAAVVLAGGRPNNDLNLAVRPRVFNHIRQLNRFPVTPGGAINLSNNVQIGKNRYGRIGLADADLFSEENSFSFAGYRIIRPEIEFAFKIQRNAEKDKYDLNDLAQSEYVADHFNWSLVNQCLRSGEQRKQVKETWYLRLVNRRTLKALFLSRLKTVITQPRRTVGFMTELVRRRLLRRAPWGHFSRSGKQFSVQIQETVSVGVLLQSEMEAGRFNRYDILLRWAAIDSVLGKQSIEGAVQHYWNMQSVRVGRAPSRRLTQFAQSVSLRGLDSRYPVVVSESGRLLDGAHRVAAALHLDSDSIAIRRSQAQHQPQYGREWFLQHGFPQALIEDLDHLASHALLTHGVYTTLILWPPAYAYWDQAESLVRQMATCVASETIVLAEEFADVVRRIYAVDDIDWWKVEVRLSAMSCHPPRIRLLLIDLTDGSFREKMRTGSHLSVEGAQIKRQVRNRFAQETPSYIHDIICHTGDNQAHSREILRILAPWISVSDLSGRVRAEASRVR